MPGVLRDPNDAEDAFQATFLVLVKKGNSIRGRDALGGWLYQVARRVAVEANKAAARRRAREREGGLMVSARTASGPALIDEILLALREEIGRLPEKHRLAVVLCELEGMTDVQAAVELNWSERTLRRRLAEARERLKARLLRRDLGLDDATLGAVFLREAHAAVPPAWNAAVVRAAIDIVNPAVTVGAASAAVRLLTREVLKIMLLQKLKLASAALLGAGLIAWAASAALASWGDDPPKAAPALAAERAVPSPPDSEPSSLDTVGTFPVAGRVLDPDDKPVAGAEVYIWHYRQFGWNPADPAPTGQKGRVALSDLNGRFHFELDNASSDWPFSDGPAWHGAQIAAVARGYGPAWIAAGSLVKGGEATLRLVRDDVPIRGRVLDTQGQPVRGLTVRAVPIGTTEPGTDIDAVLATGEMDFENVIIAGTGIRPGWAARAWSTDTGGRFEISGIGRSDDQLEIDGLGLAHISFYAVAHPSRASRSRERPVGQVAGHDVPWYAAPSVADRFDL